MTTCQRTRVELWVEPRRDMPAVNPIMYRLLAELNLVGIEATAHVPEHASIGPSQLDSRGLPDLILLKTATSFGLSMALAAEAQGARCYNPALVSIRAADKARTIGALTAVGVPVAPTYLTAGGAGCQPPPEGCPGEWVSKPVRGVHGTGVRFHPAFPSDRSLDSGSSSPYVVDAGVHLVQRRVGGDVADIKVYVAGGSWFAGRKRFAPSSYTSDEIDPVDLDQRAVEVVLRAGNALGLRCFGVDLRFEGDEPCVIDVNPFPGFRGFPGAVAALRAEIHDVLDGLAS